MKQIFAAAIVAGLLAGPAVAEDPADGEMTEGLNLMEEGARMLLRGLMEEMEPAVDALRENLDEMGPAFAEFAQSIGPALGTLLEQVDDFRNYEAPEFLPNGDIIIRSSPDAPIWSPETEGSEIEL